jgi:hypothetical protein
VTGPTTDKTRPEAMVHSVRTAGWGRAASLAGREEAVASQEPAAWSELADSALEARAEPEG